MSAMPEASRPSGNPAAVDADHQETREWLDALLAVIGTEGGERAHFLLEHTAKHIRPAPGQHRATLLQQTARSRTH